MNGSIPRAGAAVAAAVALTVLPDAAGSAQASGPAANLPVGSAYASVIGTPHAIKRTHAFTIRIWYIQKSRDILLDKGFTLSFWNPRGVNIHGAYAPGLTVSWLNPITRRWQPSNVVLDKNTTQTLDLAPAAVTVRPGSWAYIDAKITFGASSLPGTWHFEPIVPDDYDLKDSRGHDVFGFLNYSTHLFPVSVQ